MVPKPFPYPLGVGTDICNTNRIAGLLRLRDVRERWVRRTFTRLEWPAIWQSFQRVRLMSLGDNGNRAAKDYEYFVKKEEDASRATGLQNENQIWSLPDLSTVAGDIGHMGRDSFSKILADGNHPLGPLTRHLAGRWAAKEAVIKAHSYRKLFMHEVSIITPRLYPAIFPLKEAMKNKTVALIDPLCDTILMDERVAQLRALRGFGPRSQRMERGARATGSDERAQAPDQGPVYYARRSKVNESDRQVADVNISHDGKYAVAVAMAVDEPVSDAKGEHIMDDGEGLPKHEPQWGDEGWFVREKVTYEDKDPTSDPAYYKKAAETVARTEKEKIPFLD
ncbi:MAG: hypothetical protein Q9163_001761 [Psora crenata]